MLNRVTKEEFDRFIENYPRKLIWHVSQFCEPPVITYNDPSIGKFQDSVVAKTPYYDDPAGYYYEPPETREYFIRVNTHYDRIRNMSIEALAEFFEKIENGAGNDDRLGADGWLDYLQQEAAPNA